MVIKMVLTRKQVAGRYGVCLRTIDRWIALKMIPFHKNTMNGRIVFYVKELEEWEKKVDFGKID